MSSRDEHQPNRRSTAEWITFGISLAIILVLLGLVIYQYALAEDMLVVIRVQSQFDDLRQAEGQYYLPVEVTNVGGETAENVTVTLSFQGPQGRKEEASFSLQFLSAGESQMGVIVLNQNPLEGELQTNISYVRPA